MLYQQLSSILEDYAELVLPDQDESASHSIRGSEIWKAPTGQWLENALLLNPYLSDSEAVRSLVNAILEDGVSSESQAVGVPTTR